MTTQAVVVNQKGEAKPEPDDNIVSIPDRLGKNTIIGKLRAGYHIQVGADANDPDSFIQGPYDVPLTPKVARAHLTKFENVREIKEWLFGVHKMQDMKPGPPRFTPQQRFDSLVEQSRKFNESTGRGAAPAGSVSMASVAEMIKASNEALLAGITDVIDAKLKSAGVQIGNADEAAVVTGTRRGPSDRPAGAGPRRQTPAKGAGGRFLPKAKP